MFPEVLQCPICLETFGRPKVLPCGHTYCASCLQLYMNIMLIKRVTPQTYFSCPVCMADTALPEPTLSVEQWEKSFPVNSIGSCLSDVRENITEENICDICLKCNRENSATSFCKDCINFLCTVCRKHHDRITSQNRHSVVDLCDNNKSDGEIPNLSHTKMCPRHPKKHLKLFCSAHDALSCNTCGFLEHRKCERVTTIDNMLKTVDVGTKSKNVEDNIRNMKSHMKQLTSKVMENTENTKNEKSAILQQIRSLRAELNAKLLKLEDDLIAFLEGKYEIEDLNMQEQDVRGQSLITAIESDLTQFELVMANGSEVEKNIMLHNMEKNQNIYFNAISAYQEDITDVKFELVLNSSLKDLMNDLNGFGHIKVTRTKPDLPSCPTVTASQSKAEFVSGSRGTPLKGRKAVKVSEFNIKVPGDDSSSCITDVLTLHDARYFLVDDVNYKIKVYGENYQFQESMTLEEHPWNACILADNNIAVTVPVNKTIQIIGITDNLHKVREIRTRFQCYGIAVLKDQLVITTYEDEHSVLILDITGTEIRTVRPDNYQTEKLLSPFFVKINQTETVIFISYYTGHKIVAYDTSWNVLFTYTDQDMKYPLGIDTDREENIYLCGYGSYNVQQISSDGKLIKTLITKKEVHKNLSSVKCFSDMDRFILTYASCDVVEVYDMCD